MLGWRLKEGVYWTRYGQARRSRGVDMEEENSERREICEIPAAPKYMGCPLRIELSADPGGRQLLGSPSDE